MMYGRAANGVGVGFDKGPDYEPTDEELRRWEEENADCADYTLLGFNRVYSDAATMGYVHDLQESARERRLQAMESGRQGQDSTLPASRLRTPLNAMLLTNQPAEARDTPLELEGLLQQTNPSDDFWDKSRRQETLRSVTRSDVVMRQASCSVANRLLAQHAQHSTARTCSTAVFNPNGPAQMKDSSAYRDRLTSDPHRQQRLPREEDYDWHSSESEGESDDSTGVKIKD